MIVSTKNERFVEMKGLKELIQIVDLSKINLIRGLVRKYLLAISNHKYSNDEEAMRDLYPSSKYQVKYYTRLKHKARNTLIALVIAGPTVGRSDLQKGVFAAYQKFSTGKILIGMAAKTEGVKLLKESYRLALKFKLTELCLSISRALALHYALYNRRPRLSQKYASASEDYLKIFSAETIAQQVYSEIIMMLAVNSSYTPKVLSKLAIAAARLKTFEDLDSLEIHYYSSSVRINNCIAHCNYLRAVSIADSELNYFSNLPVNISVKFNILLKKGICLIAAGQHNAASFTLHHAAEIITQRSYNHNLALIFRTVQFIHAAKYPDAWKHYQDGANNCRWTILKEQWQVLHAFLYILSNAEHIDTGTRRFSVGKFLNELPLSSQDKTGQNVNIIVAQLVILLQKRRIDEFIDRAEAAKAYSYKHLKGSGMERARLFLRMIAEIPKQNFQRRLVDRAVASKLKRLEAAAISIGYHMELEIMPFTDLWQIIRNKSLKQVGHLK